MELGTWGRDGDRFRVPNLKALHTSAVWSAACSRLIDLNEAPDLPVPVPSQDRYDKLTDTVRTLKCHGTHVDSARQKHEEGAKGSFPLDQTTFARRQVEA